MTRFEILAKIAIKRDTLPPPTIIKKMEQQSLEEIPSDKVIHYQDVKKAYPEIAEKLKMMFFTSKNKITVGELKKLVQEARGDEKFWLSMRDWTMSTQKKLRDPQKVIQLNFTPEMTKLIDADPAASKFFTAIFEKYKGSQHPLRDHTFAWARVYMKPDEWIIEEIQSDYIGWEKDFSSMTEGMEKILKEALPTEAERKKLMDFMQKHLGGWEKKFLATIIGMARKQGIPKVTIFNDEFKRSYTQMSPSKAKHFYRNLPRDLGFKPDKLSVDNQEIPVWTRVTASAGEQIAAKYTIIVSQISS